MLQFFPDKASVRPRRELYESWRSRRNRRRWASRAVRVTRDTQKCDATFTRRFARSILARPAYDFFEPKPALHEKAFDFTANFS